MAENNQEESSKKKSKREQEKELNSKVDEIIEKNFEDFKSQDEIEDFIQNAFNEKTAGFNEKLDLKEKELNKKVSAARKNDSKMIDRKMKELNKKIEEHYKFMVK